MTTRLAPSARRRSRTFACNARPQVELHGRFDWFNLLSSISRMTTGSISTLGRKTKGKSKLKRSSPSLSGEKSSVEPSATESIAPIVPLRRFDFNLAFRPMGLIGTLQLQSEVYKD